MWLLSSKNIVSRSRTPYKNYHTESKRIFDSPPQMQYAGLELGLVRVRGYGRVRVRLVRSGGKMVDGKITITI